MSESYNKDIQILVTLLLELKIFELVCLYNFGDTEAVTRNCSMKKALLKYLQNSQENISVSRKTERL